LKAYIFDVLAHLEDKAAN